MRVVVSLRPVESPDVDLNWGWRWGYIGLHLNQAIPPMPLKELEVRYVERRERPFKLSDGGGLHLLVQPNGSKLWRLKYRFNGREKLLSFGKYPEVPLAVARAKRSKAKAMLADGFDPGNVRAGTSDDQGCRTFESIARAWHANREEGLDVARAKRVLARTERDAFPAIGNLPITEITVPENRSWFSRAGINLGE